MTRSLSSQTVPSQTVPPPTVPSQTVPSRARAAPGAPRRIAVVVLALALVSPVAAIGRQAETPEQLERQAEELYAADRLEEAADLYLRLADRRTEPAEQARALVLAAWLQTLRGRPDLASRTLQDALARDPAHQLDPQSFSPSFQSTFEQLRSAQGGSGLPSAESLNEGLQLLRSGDLVGARSIFEQAAAQDPGDDQVQFLLARIESRLGEAEAARTRLEALIARLDRGEPVSVDRGEVQAELGITAYRSGDSSTAERAFAAAVAANPRDAASWQNLGLARNQLDRLEGAAEAFRRALELDPQQPELNRLLANTLLRLERTGEALPLLRSATAAGSQDPRVWLDLAIAERRNGSADAAAAAFARAAALDPRNELEIAALALGQQAALELEAERPDPAVDLARRALEMDARNVDALNVLGLALLSHGDNDAAATELERARALAPRRADLANNLGKALFAAGRLEEAVEAFTAALELDPTLDTARANLEVASNALAGGAAPTGSPVGGSRAGGDSGRAATARQERAPVEPARLGATFRDVRHAGTGREAVEVTAVQAGGLVERAGLRVGDLILRVGGQGVGAFGVEDAAALERRLGELAPGGSLRLDLFRGAEALAVTVTRD